MKRIASALLLVLAVFMAGCSAYRSYGYSSSEGETCLIKCENARWSCRERCGPETVCLNDCDEAAKACRKHCPEISATEPEATY
jgi:hypothetical protein